MDYSSFPDFSPRIYGVDPDLVAPAGWDDLLGRCAAMGFDHVLLLGDQWIATTTGDDATQASATRLAEIVKLCQRHSLRLLVDFAPTRWRADDPISLDHPAWFSSPPGVPEAAEADPLPDPRFPHTLSAADELLTRLPRFDEPGAAEGLLTWWGARLTRLLEAGVSAFVCREPGSMPVPAWQHLMVTARRQHPDCRFLAWTPGCSHDQLDQLVGSGFDAVFSSGAWWDFRAPWFFREYHKLAAIAPVLAFPEDPAGPRLARAQGLDDLQRRRAGALRALHFATVSAAGWMMPMGFEFGLTEALSLARLAGSATRLINPSAYQQACADADLDFRPEVTEANRTLAQESEARQQRQENGQLRAARIALTPLSPPDSPWLLMEKQSAATEGSLLIAINPSLDRSVRVRDDSWHERLRTAAAPALTEELVLGPGAVTRWPMMPLQAVPGELDQTRPASPEMRARRIAIERVTPAVDEGRFAAKRMVGEHFIVGADLFMDGHDHLAAEVLVRAADETQWQRIPMQPDVNDRWQARVSLTRLGRHYFCIEAWSDEFETFHDGLQKKRAAGQDVSLELEEGCLLIARLAKEAAERKVDEEVLEASTALLKSLRSATARKKRSADPQVDSDKRLALLCAESTRELVRQLAGPSGARAFLARSPVEYPVEAERTAARFSSWYELFPRSQSGSIAEHGTFDDVIARLPAIRAMGFDTLYFPPIHPIGKTHRKGKNNSVTAADDDPGSPYAIGSEAGGHDAIHPQLGSLEDFLRLRDAAAGQGLELALDFAIQCSPDHPWLKEHPGWFAWRPDGSMRYAENPPKKYQDIVNVDFYAEQAIPDLWLALRDIVVFWVQQGVHVFRVDNPHTKPFPFWEWMIASVRSRYPQVIFLSEAFTRPKPMYRLAKVGFSQSYTYFTWRQGKQELIDYLLELTTDRGDAAQPCDFYRPHFFVNTPDINPVFLQRSGRAGFQIRAALAATLSGLWGVYSGFELCEASAVPGKEEYLDSEKYEIRSWDWQRPGNIIDDITLLNRIRKENPALQTHLGVRFLPVSNEHILCFVKSTPAMPSGSSSTGDAQRFGDNTVLVAINLDPFQSRQGDLALPLAGFGIADQGEQARLQVEDLLHEQRFTWMGTHQSVVLDPRNRPYRIWRIRAGET